MKNIIKLIQITQCFLLISLMSIAQKSNIMERWDQKITKEANIWQNLLSHYLEEDRNLNWKEREQAFSKVLTEFPKSQWADDAALLMVGEKFIIDHNLDNGIAALREVIKNYPSESTIIDDWIPQRGCHINDAWLMWAPNLITLNEDRSVKTAVPFDKDGNISILEKEALAYFENLEKYPQLTKDVAQYMIALMLQQKGKINEAILELDMLLANYPDLSKIRTIDFDVSKRENGHLIGNEPPFDALPIWRIQYSASILLINLYVKQNRIEEAKATCSNLVQECSPDGWYWNINEFIGNIYESFNLPTLANEQYDKSLNGIKDKSKNQDIRMNALLSSGNATKPEGFISWEEETLKSYRDWIDRIEKRKKKLNTNK